MNVVSKRRYGGVAATTVLQTLVAGLISGFLAIVLAIGFANLLLTGDMRVHTPVIVGMALFSTMVLNAVGALASPIRGGISTVQEVPVVVMSAMAAAIVANMAGSAQDETILVTIVAACMVSTALAGASLFALGLFGLGGLIRFVPYPVVGGFLAGTGWLIFQGGLTVITGAPVTADTLGALLDGNTQMKIGIAGALVAAIAFLGTRPNDTVTVPVAILAALIAYHIALAVIGVSTEQLSAAGWLVPLPADGRLWPPLTPDDLGVVDWRQVGLSLVAFPGLIIVSVMALLMNATGIELDRGRDGDLDGELRSVGLQNLAAAPTGGMMGYPAISLTILATRLGAMNRGAPLVVAALCAAALLLQDAVLGLVPTPLLGGLLVWIGGSLLAEWLVRSYRRLALGEYLIVALIFLVIAIVGFTWGILVGLVAAIVLFVIEYSRADIVRLFVTGKDYQSSIDASEERRQSLHLHGDAILIMRLQGFLFFGTADRLRQRVERRAAGGTARTHFVVIDFRRVTGLDSSTVLSFMRLSQTAAREDFTIVFTGVSEATRATMLRGGLDVGEDSPIHFIADLDAGLKWCEDALLAQSAPGYVADAARPLARRLHDILNDADSAAKVAAYCERMDIAEGATIIEQGTPSADIFFVESGHASVAVASSGHAPVRLATVGPGAIIGEVAFYLGEERSASVVAEETMVVWRFSRASIERLQTELPEIGLRFHQGIAAMLAKRLTRTNHLVRLLAD